MTIDALAKRLKTEQDKGLGRLDVLVDKESLFDGRGAWQNCEIKDSSLECIYVGDGDGFIAKNKDGIEKTKTCLILSGRKIERNLNEYKSK
jgi:hypothetical protein